MAFFNLNANKISRSVRKCVLARLPWLKKRNSLKTNSSSSSGSTSPYESLPDDDLHQTPEADENALNEALEARLMELIASSPAEKPIPLTFTVEASLSPSSGVRPDLFDFGGSFVCLRLQTSRQKAQAQESA